MNPAGISQNDVPDIVPRSPPSPSDALLADPEVEAIYNPLPNSLHAEWSIRTLEAGKHVLCEKPIVTIAADARDVRRRAPCRPCLAEAFPYRS